MICFQISIFEPLGTIQGEPFETVVWLWFAFKLVSLNHWEQCCYVQKRIRIVVICFQISIFEPLGTIDKRKCIFGEMLWFAFKLVSLNHWEQYKHGKIIIRKVVICFQISIFEPLGTITWLTASGSTKLWFAFKLVSLNHWEQWIQLDEEQERVVICFQISIFEPLGTIQSWVESQGLRCDLLSN